MDLIIKYIDDIEVSESKKVCKCTWQWDVNRGRKVLNNVNFECPIHSREGLILTFIEENLKDILRAVEQQISEPTYTMEDIRAWVRGMLGNGG